MSRASAIQEEARIDLADGESVLSDAPDASVVLSRFFGRDVELARAARHGYTIDQYHPDEENYDPQGRRDEVVEVRLGAAVFNERGLPSAVPDGSFFDAFPRHHSMPRLVQPRDYVPPVRTVSKRTGTRTMLSLSVMMQPPRMSVWNLWDRL